jgi:minor extracellular serine protease Vpr
MTHNLFRLLIILALALSISPAAMAQGEQPERTMPQALDELKLDSPLNVEAGAPVSKLGRGLLSAHGPSQVIVRLAAEPLAKLEARGQGSADQRGQLQVIDAQQDHITRHALGLDPNTKVLGTARKAINAVMLEIDADSLRALAADPAVVSINPVIDYQIDLSETVPYIGASALHDLDVTGEGVSIAILDTGVDYTHANLGGPGVDKAFHQAYGENPRSGHNRKITNRYLGELLFPTGKVVGGYDFVGEFWPDEPLAPDPNPIDLGGHGTHVADISAGLGGVAPGAEIYAVKVCATFSTACSGVALIQAMDFALDPNGDDDLSDHVDLINMSLGALYGQAFDDDLSLAVDNATEVGVLTMAASGNAADKPYVTDSPGAAPSAFSVAQTSVPSAVQILMEIVSPPEIAGQYPATFQPWSVALTTAIEAPVQYGDGAGGNLLGCDAFVPGSLSGKIVLVDRGACNFTLKIKNIGESGGLVGIIGLVAPGEPFEGGDGGDRPITIPGFMISQAIANTIKSQLGVGVVARFDPATGIPLVMHMVGSSGRGPTMLTNIIKPEIGAPGASVSAIAGTGTGVGPFGGTSGATPMITGSAALLLSAYPDRTPLEIKALLMNTAETNIMNRPAFFGGDLAAISRIGGGEVRVNRAYHSPAAAWDADAPSGALSFGFQDITDASTSLTRSVTVRNYSGSDIDYNISSSLRFANDAANGAVQVLTPGSVSVPAGGTSEFDVTLMIDGTLLRQWQLNSGSRGANGDFLTLLEYDGYITLDDPATPDADDLHLAWMVLPRLSGDVEPDSTEVLIDDEAFGYPAGFVELTNNGIGTAYIDSYSLIGTSPDLPEGGEGEQSPIIDLRYVGVTTIPVGAGFCSANASFLLGFAVNTWERQTHANAPAAFEFDLDTDQDGVFDYAVFNFDLSFTGFSDGRNVTWVLNLATGQASAFFFTDHGTNSGNTVLLLCGEQIGMNASNLGQPIDMDVLAVDIYFTGNVTDSLEDITIIPGGERYLGILNDIGSGATEILTVLDFGEAGTNPTETGVLLLLDGARSGGVRGGAPEDNEAIAITAVYP